MSNQIHHQHIYNTVDVETTTAKMNGRQTSDIANTIAISVIINGGTCSAKLFTHVHTHTHTHTNNKPHPPGSAMISSDG